MKNANFQTYQQTYRLPTPTTTTPNQQQQQPQRQRQPQAQPYQRQHQPLSHHNLQQQQQQQQPPQQQQRHYNNRLQAATLLSPQQQQRQQPLKRPTHLHLHSQVRQQQPFRTTIATSSYTTGQQSPPTPSILPALPTTATTAPMSLLTTNNAHNFLQNQCNNNYNNNNLNYANMNPLLSVNNYLPFLQNNTNTNTNNNNNNSYNHGNNYNNLQQQLQQEQLQQQQQQQQRNLQQLQRHLQQEFQLQLQESTQQPPPLQQMQQQQLHLQSQSHQQQLQQQQQQHHHAADIPGTIAADKFTMDANEISNFLANELFMQQLATVDGMQSGVPTLTTSTLTPTTLRSIEETFIQLTSEPTNAPYQAGFIPPPLATYPSASSTPAPTGFNGSVHDFTDANLETESEDSQASWTAAQLNEENSLATTDTSSAATDSTSFQNGLGNNSLATSNTSSVNEFSDRTINIAMALATVAKNANNNNNSSSSNITSNSATTGAPPITRRNQGGRRPIKPTNLSPEEEEKRRIRRERNKLAAARCRKRRVDQTNELLEEVAQLERKRDGLNKDIEKLNSCKQDLEYILEAHRPTCQKIRQDLLSVNTYGGLIVPSTPNGGVDISAAIGTNSNDSNSGNGNIIGLDTTLASTGRSASPIDLKPVILHESILQRIKDEPLDSALDSNSSLEHEGPPSPKRLLLSSSNHMIPPPLPTFSATLAAAASAASASLNTPIVTTAPVSFGSFVTTNNNNNSNATLNALNALNTKSSIGGAIKQRPNSLPTMPRNLAISMNNKPPTDINGVAIQTPSTGMFNFDSLMDGGTGLTPVQGPLVPNCSSQNKHPMELTTPTSQPSNLVSL